MNWRDWINKSGMKSIKLNAKFLELEFEPKQSDRDAAWELYIELLTRIATQPLLSQDGDESAALESIHEIFDLTRNIIKKYGANCIEFTKIAIVVLNQIVRPFTAKWHKLSLNDAFNDQKQCESFREELCAIQNNLKIYTKMLAGMAGVEDLTCLEDL